LNLDEGEVYTFGGNSFGALGHGHKNDLSVPTLVKGLKDTPIASIACGIYTPKTKNKKIEK
jgi:hypothetical protein